MSKPSNILADYKLNTKERTYIGLGLTILSVVVVAALVGYAIAPLFIGKQWVVVSPTLHIASMLVGSILVWLGLRKTIKQKTLKIDRLFRNFLPYRIIRWITAKLFGLTRFLATIIFFTWINQPSSKSTSPNDQNKKGPDDIWDSHPKHYYDNEPPKPFS